MLSFFSVTTIKKCVREIIEEHDIWDINSATAKIKHKIKMEAFYVNSFVVVNTILAIISGIFHAIPLKDDEDLFYPLAIFEEYTPKWKDFFSLLFRVCFVPISFVMLTPCHVFIYMTSHFRFQFLKILI